MFSFAFATGIEGSAPTIRQGRERVDQMEKCGFYNHWRTDFELLQELGVEFLRYGPPLHRTWLGDGYHDWVFADETFGRLRRLNLIPIADLCHFGVPDWIGDFQNPDFPALFAAYAGAFAERYPWLQLYTPVNEMFICATFSARRGWWNEQLVSDTAFVTAVKHLVKANVLAMEAILRRRPDALFIQSESSEQFHADCPEAATYADRYNRGRFLALDLNYARQVDGETYAFLMEHGLDADEYAWFMRGRLKHHCVLGADYYHSNEHWVDEEGRTRASGEVFGYSEVVRQYFDRYGLPLMHTETNIGEGPVGDEAVKWLWKEWANVLRLRSAGLPVLGFTWYSLTDQMDWDTSLREQSGRVNPVGLYDLDRNPRQVGRAYKKLVNSWKQPLAFESGCLTLPVFRPQDAELAIGEVQARYAQEIHASGPRGHRIEEDG